VCRVRFSNIGDIILLGTFKACIKDEETKAMYTEISAEEVGLRRQGQDINEVTEYGKHFVVLGSAHG
jgi:hypothetical protein